MGHNPPEFIRGWSEDISATGAKLITSEELSDKTLWLKFLIPGREPCFLEANVMRGEQAARGFKSQAMHWYGVKFMKLLSEKDFMELALTHVDQLTSQLGDTPQAAACSVRA